MHLQCIKSNEMSLRGEAEAISMLGGYSPQSKKMRFFASLRMTECEGPEWKKIKPKSVVQHFKNKNC